MLIMKLLLLDAALRSFLVTMLFGQQITGTMPEDDISLKVITNFMVLLFCIYISPLLNFMVKNSALTINYYASADYRHYSIGFSGTRLIQRPSGESRYSIYWL